MTTPKALQCQNDMWKAGDTNGCGPIALAILTDENTRYGSAYDRAAADLARLGRKKRKGTWGQYMERAFYQRGFKLVNYTEKLRSKGAKTALSLGWTLKKHYPNDRFLVRYRGHYAAAMNGIIHDWSGGTKKHLLEVQKLVPHDGAIDIMEAWRDDFA